MILINFLSFAHKIIKGSSAVQYCSSELFACMFRAVLKDQNKSSRVQLVKNYYILL